MQNLELRRLHNLSGAHICGSRVAAVVLSAALLLAGCTLTQKMAWISAENPFAQDPGSRGRGEVVYATQCASCHGPLGRGDGPAGEILEVRPTDLQAYASRVEQGLFAAQVAYGKDKNPDMPRFIERLSKDEIWDVTSFMYALAASDRANE